MIVLHLLQLNGSVNCHRKWKLISSEVGVKLKNRENSKFSKQIKLWSKCTGRTCVPCVRLRAPLDPTCHKTKVCSFLWYGVLRRYIDQSSVRTVLFCVCCSCLGFVVLFEYGQSLVSWCLIRDFSGTTQYFHFRLPLYDRFAVLYKAEMFAIR